MDETVGLQEVCTTAYVQCSHVPGYSACLTPIYQLPRSLLLTHVHLPSQHGTQVYPDSRAGARRYALRSMVCYYGQHYQALVLVPEAGGWLMFDDTRVSRVGSWADVRRKCEAGRIQPSVLFYETAA